MNFLKGLTVFKSFMSHISWDFSAETPQAVQLKQRCLQRLALQLLHAFLSSPRSPFPNCIETKQSKTRHQVSLSKAEWLKRGLGKMSTRSSGWPSSDSLWKGQVQKLTCSPSIRTDRDRWGGRRAEPWSSLTQSVSSRFNKRPRLKNKVDNN